MSINFKLYKMKNFLMIAVLLLFSVSAMADVKLPEIREVLKHVETNYNPDAIGDNGDSFGILQIKQVAIDDVNRVCGTSYTHQDAFNIAYAEEIFDLYVTFWAKHLEKREGRKVTDEDIVRIWNGGPIGYKSHSTKYYFKKYLKFKNKSYLCTMETNKRKCLVGGKLGLITESYTHTQDVFMFKSKRMMYGVHKKYVKLVPMELPIPDTSQYRINFG